MIRMRSLLTLLFILFSGSVLMAQGTRNVSGKVLDTAGAPLNKASVSLFYETPGDTLRTLTNSQGEYRFAGVKSRPFTVKVSFLGFNQETRQVKDEAAEITLNTITLNPAYRSLQEIVISTPPIVIKEDTVEFKADSFKVKPNAMVEDLLKKLPGVAVDKDGNITAQGKSVTRVKVNGKDFFQGDAKTATRELSADMIDKVQIVDDYGDQANMSGIKDGEPDKVINLQLKKDKNKGVFGRVTAGAGTDQRYQVNGNVNYFNNNKQLSLIGNTNNINQSLFSQNDPGSSGGNTGGGNQGGGGGVRQAFSLGGLGNNNTGGDGISTTHAIGTNFRNDFENKKGSVYGSYVFTRRMTDGIRDVSQQNIFESNSFTNNQSTKFYNQSNNHRAFINWEYNIDSFNYIKFTPNFSYSESNNKSRSDFGFIDSKGLTTSEGYNLDSTLSNSPSLNITALYNRRFRKRGRNLSVNLTYNTAENESDRNTINQTTNFVQTPPVTAILKQLINQDNNNNGINLRAQYSEPIRKDRFVDFIYQYRHTYTKNDRTTYDVSGASPVILPALTNAFENYFNEQRYGLNFRTVKKKYNYTLGVSVQPLELKGYSITKDSTYTPQRRTMIFPVARFVYNFTRTKGLNFNYQGNARNPSFTQLQPVRDISNPQYQTQGNPNLKPEQSHNFSLFFNNFNFQSGKVLFTGINANFIQNQIVNNTISLGAGGAQLTIPENVNGYYNLTGFYNWQKPFKNRTYVVSLNGTVNYNHNINLIDSARSIGTNILVSQGLTFEYNLKEWLELDFGARYNLNSARYSLQEQLNQNFGSWVLTSNSRMDVPGGLTFRYDLQYTINNGLAEGVNGNIALLNASLEKTILKKKNGFIRLYAFDILNQNKSITRSVTANSIVDTRTNRLTRYVMLSFTYRLNRFSGQTSGTNRQPAGGQQQFRMREQ
ncbi:MAG: TonB-dependent receptor [Chitinophagaceae bacterium]